MPKENNFGHDECLLEIIYIRFPKIHFPNPESEFLTFRFRLNIYLFGIFNLEYG